MTTSSVRRERTNADGIGQVLRTARAERGVSLVELQARTKVRVKYLAALEDERFDELPPLPFARGFLRLVAEELNLDPEPLIRRLDAVMSASAEVPAESLQRLDAAVTPAVPRSKWRRPAVMAVVFIVLAGGALAVYSYRQVQKFSEPAPVTAPPGTQRETPAKPGVEPGAAVSSPQPAATAVEPEPQAPLPAAGPTGVPTGEPAASDGVTVEVQASGRSWLRVVVDDQPVFEGFLAAGETLRWRGRAAVLLRAGNAGAVQVTVNGRPLGVLGQPGEVVDRTFTKDTSP